MPGITTQTNQRVEQMLTKILRGRRGKEIKPAKYSSKFRESVNGSALTNLHELQTPSCVYETVPYSQNWVKFLNFCCFKNLFATLVGKTARKLTKKNEKLPSKLIECIMQA